MVLIKNLNIGSDPVKRCSSATGVKCNNTTSHKRKRNQKYFLKFEWTLLILKCGCTSKQYLGPLSFPPLAFSLKCCWDRKFDQITSFSLKALSHSSWHWPAEAQGAGWVSLQGSDEPSWWQTSLSVEISLQFSASALGPACNMMIYRPVC